MAREIVDHCGVFGAYNAGSNISKIARDALYSLQHRGEEAAGIGVSDGRRIYITKGTGLVVQAINLDSLPKRDFSIAIGHTRYSTSLSSSIEYAQPVYQEGDHVALVHNGTINSTYEMEEFLTSRDVCTARLNDSGLMQKTIETYLRQGASFTDALIESYPKFTGVHSTVVMSKDGMAVIRGPFGIRPMIIGELDNGGVVAASETCALDIINAKPVRSLEPDELLIYDRSGMRSFRLGTTPEKQHVFEPIYSARMDSLINGVPVVEIRKSLGRWLARTNPMDADIVFAVPESANPLAQGYAEYSGLPLDVGFYRNPYTGRTFINPDTKVREMLLELKLNAIAHKIIGKRVIVADDSIVRSSTSRKAVQKLRKAGAAEVNVVIGSPPYKFGDYMGDDTPDESTLAAHNRSIEEVRLMIGADSLIYQTLGDMAHAFKDVGLDIKNFCLANFDGNYSIPISGRVPLLAK